MNNRQIYLAEYECSAADQGRLSVVEWSVCKEIVKLKLT